MYPYIPGKCVKGICIFYSHWSNGAKIAQTKRIKKHVQYPCVIRSYWLHKNRNIHSWDPSLKVWILYFKHVSKNKSIQMLNVQSFGICSLNPKWNHYIHEKLIILAHATVHLERFINSETLLFIVLNKKHGAALLHLEKEPLLFAWQNQNVFSFCLVILEKWIMDVF